MPSLNELYKAYKLKEGSRLGEFTLESIDAVEHKGESHLYEYNITSVWTPDYINYDPRDILMSLNVNRDIKTR